MAFVCIPQALGYSALAGMWNGPPQTKPTRTLTLLSILSIQALFPRRDYIAMPSLPSLLLLRSRRGTYR